MKKGGGLEEWKAGRIRIYTEDCTKKPRCRKQRGSPPESLERRRGEFASKMKRGFKAPTANGKPAAA